MNAVDTVSTNKKYAVDTVSTNKKYAVDTVSTNKKFVVDTVSSNKNAAKQTRQHAVKNKGGGRTVHSVTKCTDRQEGTHPQCDQTNGHTQGGDAPTQGGCTRNVT